VGAQAAANGYFNKAAKDLTVDESAMLAAVIPAPTYYSPYGNHTKELVSRQHYVIDLMQSQGYITKNTAEAAKKVDTLAKIVPSHSKYKNIIAPHFVLAAQEELEKEYGATNVQKAGFRVITTLNLTLQGYAEKAITDNIYMVDRDGGDNAALVSIDVATGQVLAEVGSRDFNYPDFGELNMATTPRSPGSSFKPYDYATLMTVSKNWGAGSIIYDLVTNFGSAWNNYTPRDYDFKEQGAQPIRYALGGSRNIPAIKAMYVAGIQNVINTAKKLGIVSGTSCEPDCGLSSAIGDGSEIRLDEHANAFATFSRMGVYKPKTYILKISDTKNKTIKEWKDTGGKQVLDPQVAYIINDMLSDDAARYIRGSSNFNLPGVTTALKTGTTNGMDNGWLMMYSTKIASGVWIGHHENTAMWCGVYGCMEGKTGVIMAQYMRKAHEGLAGAGDKWQKPSGVKTVCVDPITGYATNSGGRCDIFPSWYQARYANTTQTAIIDTVSGKLATDCTPAAAKQTITGGGILSELPTSDSLYNNFIAPIKARYGSAGGLIPTATDDVHNCSDTKPAVSLTVSEVSDGEYELTAKVTQGTHPLKTLNFKADGQIVSGGSFSITANGTYPSTPLTYIATSTDPITFTAEVIDNVLYSNTSAAKTFTPTSTPVPTPTPTPTPTG
jgi:penicillin-binding protein 1A